MPSLWDFDEVEWDDADRATQLRRSPRWPELIRLVCDALRTALRAGNARFGFDESSSDSRDLRANIQFPIGRQLFDIELAMFLSVNSEQTSGCQDHPESFKLHRRAQFRSGHLTPSRATSRTCAGPRASGRTSCGKSTPACRASSRRRTRALHRSTRSSASRSAGRRRCSGNTPPSCAGRAPSPMPRRVRP